MSAAGTAPVGHSLTGGRLLARNVVLNLGGWVLPAVAALVAMPLLVRGLGAPRFGVLALAWTALGYFSLFDLGVGRAVTHGVADRLARGGDEKEAGALIWTSLAVLLPVGVLGGLVFWILVPLVTGVVLQVPPEMSAETQQSFRILAIAVPFFGATAALRGALEARQLFGVVNALRVPHGLVTFLGPVAALPFSRSLVPAVVVLVVGRVALCIAHLAASQALIPGFVITQPRFDRHMFRHLVKFGGWMTVSNIISPLMNTLDRFVVGAALGVTVVAYYAAPSELVTKMWLFTAALLPVVFPALATAAAADPRHAGRLFAEMLRTTFVVLLLPTCLLVLFAPELLHYWLGASFSANSTIVLQILAIAVFVNTLGQGAMTLIQSMGRPDITGKYHMAELPLYAISLWLLMSRFGIHGVALAWAVRAVADTLLLLLTCPGLLAESRPSVSRALVWIAVTVPALTACMFVHSLSVRIALAIVITPVWAAMTWRWLRLGERKLGPRWILNEVWPSASG